MSPMCRVIAIGGAWVAFALLSGCGAVRGVREADATQAQTQREAQVLMERMHRTTVPMPRDTVVVTDTPWVDLNPIRTALRRIPADLDCSVVTTSMLPMGLLEIAHQISTDCGLPVQVTPDALTAAGANNGESAGSADAVQALPTPGFRLPSTVRGMAGASLEVSAGEGGDGPASELLDRVVSRLGLWWRYVPRTKSVVIYYLDTRTFRINAFPTQTALRSTVQSGSTISSGTSGGGGAAAGGGSTSSSAGSSQTTTVTLTTDLYTDLGNTIKAVLTPNVGRMAISSSTGMVSVTDTPDVLDRVERVLDNENASLGQMIILHTKVLSLTTDQANEGSVNLDALYRNLPSKFGITVGTPFQAANSAGTLGISVLGTGKLAGSNVVLSALATLGKVTTITSPSEATLNLQPASVQIAQERGFIASSQSPTQVGTGNNLVAGGLTPGSVTLGFNMTLIPRLIEKAPGELLLQYSIDITALLGEIKTVEAAGTKIQFADKEVVKFAANQVRLRDGETLILQGFERSTHLGSRQGTVSPFAWMLGGGARSARSRQTIVIMITPEIVPLDPVTEVAEVGQ